MSPCSDCAHYNPHYRRCGMDSLDRKPDDRDCWWYDKKGTVKNDSERDLERDPKDGAGD